MSIQVLPDSVVAQIAAGEVVERPSSIVKELIENSLDAGARNIHIEVAGGGRERVRISDDGVGIPPDEVETAFCRHATSKLKSAEDLASIETLGFRGEALASIASVSRLTMVTRHVDFPSGVSIYLEGGQLMHQRSVGAPVGTVVTVESVFYNTPARLKFLKKETTEKRHIVLLVTRYAMAYPQVRFVLVQDGREVFHSSGSGNLADVLVSALGLDNFKNMVEVFSGENAASNHIQVLGYTSVPNLSRSDRNHITLFVNGRWIQDSRLSHAVTQAYHTFLMTGRYPIAVLMVRIPAVEVDVNVHPTKAEVRFRDADAVYSAIQRAVRRAIVSLAQTPAMRRGWVNSWGSVDSHSAVSNDQQVLSLDMLDPGQHTHSRFNPVSNDTDEDNSFIANDDLDLSIKPRTLPILRVIGQVNSAYIVAEGPSGLYLIDQHAAHERVLYEEFMDEQMRKPLVSQFTLEAQTVSLPAAEARLIEEHLDTLSKIGFDLEPFGANIFILRGLPAMLADREPIDVLMNIIADLELEREPGRKTIEDKIITQVCKQAAVKAGQILSYDEMQVIVRRLERCRMPHTCPHGRPTMLHMTSEHIAREFGRMG
jgi:DNA mismatch repair protein MutL